MAVPRVFISYSHDSEDHKEWVRRFTTDLRTKGIDAMLDQWDLSPGQDIAAFMTNGITAADRVILVCSEQYVTKAEQGTGGVAFERLIVTAELVQTIDTKKFLPIVRSNRTAKKIPNFLGLRMYVNFNVDTEYDSRLEEAVREIHGVPLTAKPPLGPNPFSGAAPGSPMAARVAGPSGLTGAGRAVLDEPWFTTHLDKAGTGLSALGLSGSMELRFALHEPISKSQLELLNAVQKSEIRTFGWPIAVLLQNRDEYRPKPVSDGIFAEISIPRSVMPDRPSYDLWALRDNGDFFLLQSLFEDQRANGDLFFDTRIVRVTEAILFCSNLYHTLGVAAEARVSIKVTHRGLKGRALTTASRNRHVFPSTATEDVSETQIVDSIAQLRPRVVEHVMQVTEPMFMLFDFKKFEGRVYEEIVANFVAGRVS